jgi:murein L,D-transpeptidase YafK
LLGRVPKFGYADKKAWQSGQCRMRFFRILVVLVLALGLSACADNKSKFKTYNGPEVTSVQVHKGKRKMYLLHHEKVLKTYNIALGFAPEGHKQFEGDGKTPEGTYFIDRRNPNSAFHLSIGISYPNQADREYAKSLGKSPGGDIFIHGGPRRPTNRQDWTEGCIAVTDKEMERIYAMVKNGTPIHILP